MIKIIMYANKWRLNIGNDEGEKWEFENKEKCLECLNELMVFKEKYGQLKKEERYHE